MEAIKKSPGIYATPGGKFRTMYYRDKKVYYLGTFASYSDALDARRRKECEILGINVNERTERQKIDYIMERESTSSIRRLADELGITTNEVRRLYEKGLKEGLNGQ